MHESNLKIFPPNSHFIPHKHDNVVTNKSLSQVVQMLSARINKKNEIAMCRYVSAASTNNLWMTPEACLNITQPRQSADIHDNCVVSWKSCTFQSKCLRLYEFVGVYHALLIIKCNTIYTTPHRH